MRYDEQDDGYELSGEGEGSTSDGYESSSEGESNTAHEYDMRPDGPGQHEKDRDDMNYIHESGEGDIYKPGEDGVRVTFDQVVRTISDHGTSLESHSSRLGPNGELTALASAAASDAQTRLASLEKEHETLIIAHGRITNELRVEVERHEVARREDAARLEKLEADVKRYKAAREEDESRLHQLEADVMDHRAARRKHKAHIQQLEAKGERDEVERREDKVRLEQLKARFEHGEVERREDRAPAREHHRQSCSLIQ